MTEATDHPPSSSRDAHALSAPFAIDPAYSRERVVPAPAGLSLFSRERGGDCWLYFRGALEAFLLNRMRHEAFLTCVNVGHPGRFMTFQPILYARRQFNLDAVPARAECRLRHCGRVDMRLNGQIVCHAEATAGAADAVLDLAPLLKAGENHVRVRLHHLSEPPTFAITGGVLNTDSPWDVSVDDVVWEQPERLPLVASPCFPHREELPRLLINSARVADGLYDFGVEVFGHPILDTRGHGRIRVFAGESRAEADADGSCAEQVVPAIEAGHGPQTLAERLAFRYLRVEAAPGAGVDRVRCSAPTYPAAYRGAFACSDEALTRIWMNSAYTLRLCMHELFIDGVKRDRLPWAGDLFLAELCDSFSFHEEQIVRRTLTALRGESPEEVPLSGIIDYSMYWLLALRNYVMHFGDVECWLRSRAYARRLLAALESKETPEGLLPSAAFHWVFIDWAEVAKDGICSGLQMLYIMALDAAARLFQISNDHDTAGRLAEKRDGLRRRCAQMFWDGGRSLFVDHWSEGRRGTHTSRHANLLAILSGVAPDTERRELARRTLLSGGLPPAGTPFMMVLEACALGRCGLRAEMLDCIRACWGGMLDAGATTFWEAYSPGDSAAGQLAFYGRPFGKSLCHAWSAGPLFLLSGELLGAEPLEPGWKTFRLSPCATGLEWLSVSIPTPHGDICVEAERDRIQVRSPQGTRQEQ